MKSTKIKQVMTAMAICVAGSMLGACGGESQNKNAAGDTVLMANGEACFPLWVSTSVYVAGNHVSYNSKNYTAAYWTQGDNPATHSGAAGSGQPWVSGFACGGTTTTATTTTSSERTTSSSRPTTTVTTTSTTKESTTTTTKASTSSTGGSTTTTTKGTTTTTTCPSIPQFISGHAYPTGATVYNAGGFFTCKVGGWCSSSAAAFEPGVGWAWTDAWSAATSNACVVSTPVPFVSVSNTQFSGVTAAQNTVVTDGASWASLWNMHTKNQVPQPALPPVSFDRTMVLGVFLGNRVNGCYSVKITDVSITNAKLVVKYQETGPASPTSNCNAVMTYPAHIVTVDKSALPVQFVSQ